VALRQEEQLRWVAVVASPDLLLPTDRDHGWFTWYSGVARVVAG